MIKEIKLNREKITLLLNSLTDYVDNNIIVCSICYCQPLNIIIVESGCGYLYVTCLIRLKREFKHYNFLKIL